ncbi:hypothetical protein B7463_g8087, partial [Scytalidium lignicola]
MQLEKPNIRKTRKRGQNVRHGCSTCKVRRKKCDETRPACLRCASTGYICDFLTIEPTRASKGDNNNSSTPPTTTSNPRNLLLASKSPASPFELIAPPSGLGPLSHQEFQHFDFFRTRCIRDFSVCCSTFLWSQVILQASHTETCIFHAVLAISSLYRSQTLANQPSQTHAGDGSSVEFSLKQYNTAIRILRERLQINGGDLRLAVLACLLFLSIEILQGRDQIAVLHIKNGESLLKALPSTTQFGSGSDGFDELVSTFSLLSFQGLSFCGLVSTSHTPLSSIRPHFPNVYEAILDFNDVVKVVMLFLRRYGHEELKTLPERPPPSAVLTELLQLQTTLRTWNQKFTSFISDEESAGRKINSMASVLKIQHLLVRIYISTHFFHDQLIFDQYLDLFGDMLALTAEVIDSGEMYLLESRGPCFTPFIVMNRPLYFVACKCRDPSLRRRAIDLMKRIGSEEGIYTGRTVAKVAEWVCNMEEDGCTDRFVSGPKRLHDVTFDFNLDMTGKVWARRRNEAGEWDYLCGELDLT